MPIPEKTLAHGLNIAVGMSVYGKPLHDMSREELIAIAALGWDAERKACENKTSTGLQAADFMRRCT